MTATVGTRAHARTCFPNLCVSMTGRGNDESSHDSTGRLGRGSGCSCSTAKEGSSNAARVLAGMSSQMKELEAVPCRGSPSSVGRGSPSSVGRGSPSSHRTMEKNCSACSTSPSVSGASSEANLSFNHSCAKSCLPAWSAVLCACTSGEKIEPTAPGAPSHDVGFQWTRNVPFPSSRRGMPRHPFE